MKTIEQLRKNLKEYHDKPWFVMGLLVGGFETDNIKRKYPKVYKAIFKDISFDDNTLENMFDFLNSRGMKKSEQEKLRNWFNEWKPVDEGDEDSKYWFISGFINGQVELHQEEWITFSEVSKTYGIKETTLRMAASSGRFKDNEIRKSGKVWLVTKKGIERLYGDFVKK